jgi:hypothetical protein
MNIEFVKNNLLQSLTKKEVLKGTVKSLAIGLVLFVLGLGGIVALGVLGAKSGTGNWAIVIGIGSVLLMIPSALLLGIGFQCLRLSMVGIYSLLVSKPVFGFTVVVDFRRKP